MLHFSDHTIDSDSESIRQARLCHHRELYRHRDEETPEQKDAKHVAPIIPPSRYWRGSKFDKEQLTRRMMNASCPSKS